MIFSKVTNEYKQENTAVRDEIYKIFGVTVCLIKTITTNVNVVNSLNVRKTNKKIKGFEV